VSARSLDHRLLLLARTRAHGPLRDRVVSTFSRTGEHAASWLLVGAVGAIVAGPGERRTRWVRGMRAVAVSLAVNSALKRVVRRPRPALDDLPPLTPTVSPLSFPSAHATTSFAAARGYRGLLPAWILYGLAAGYTLGRPYLGVHYPSDVLSGALLGTGLGAAACR
jgi:membrane-associated phospholipid phosphatase